MRPVQINSAHSGCRNDRAFLGWGGKRDWLQRACERCLSLFAGRTGMNAHSWGGEAKGTGLQRACERCLSLFAGRTTRKLGHTWDVGMELSSAEDASMRTNRPNRRWIFAAILGGLIVLIARVGGAQIPPPRLEGSRSPDLVARREAIVGDERARRAAIHAPRPPWDADDDRPDDGASRFDPLSEVVAASTLTAPSVNPAEAAINRDAANQMFALAMAAAKTPSPPFAFVDECLRATLQREPNHAEARRLLGFIPHEKTGWATPFAASEIALGKVKDPTFGWVPADWVPHLKRGELPAPRGGNRWLPADQADALRSDWKSGWTIRTEHFEIHANVPLSGVIAFGQQLETFHQLFFAIMADVIGGDQLPLARRLKQPGLAPGMSNKPRHQVYFFATRDEYIQYLAPSSMGGGAKESLGIYLPKKESKEFGGKSYFFNDIGGQLDVSTTLYHEVSHQLLFESAGSADYLKNTGNYWVFEGLGTYFETVQTLEDGSIRVGGLVGPRIAQAKARLVERGELIPIEEFVAMGRGAFQGERGGDIYLHYVEAMALAVFLMQADDGRYREPFLDYARDAYKGQFRGSLGRTLDDRLDVRYPELQRQFISYLGRVADSRRAEPKRNKG